MAAMLSALDRLHRAGTRLAGEVVLVATVYEETLKCGGYQVNHSFHEWYQQEYEGEEANARLRQFWEAHLGL